MSDHRLRRASPRERLPALLRAMPKAELHLHIEGSLEPELIFALAQRNGVALPYAERRGAARGLRLHRSAELPRHLLRRRQRAAEGAGLLRHGDGLLASAPPPTTWCTPRSSSTRRRTPRAACRSTTVIDGLPRALRRARSASSASARALILCFLRHLSEEDAFATLEQALPYRDHFIGVGLDSSERGHPPEKFARVFARCRELGLHLVAHAGEEGPPAYIGARSTCCKVERIDHGVRCVEDPALVQRLARRAHAADGVPAVQREAVRVRRRMADHNLAAAARRRACAPPSTPTTRPTSAATSTTTSSPTFAALPQLGARHAYALARNSFEASFVDAAGEARHERSRLDSVFASFAQLSASRPLARRRPRRAVRTVRSWPRRRRNDWRSRGGRRRPGRAPRPARSAAATGPHRRRSAERGVPAATAT